MQKIFASILLIALLGQTFNQGWFYVDYLVRKAEYVKRCENTNLPELNCNGQCQIMKKIKAQIENENGPAPVLSVPERADIISSKSFYPELSFSTVSLPTNYFLKRSMGVVVSRANTFFHPPEQV